MLEFFQSVVHIADIPKQAGELKTHLQVVRIFADTVLAAFETVIDHLASGGVNFFLRMPVFLQLFDISLIKRNLRLFDGAVHNRVQISLKLHQFHISINSVLMTVDTLIKFRQFAIHFHGYLPRGNPFFVAADHLPDIVFGTDDAVAAFQVAQVRRLAAGNLALGSAFLVINKGCRGHGGSRGGGAELGDRIQIVRVARHLFLTHFQYARSFARLVENIRHIIKNGITVGLKFFKGFGGGDGNMICLKLHRGFRHKLQTGSAVKP